jgi:hypothetical protein
MFRPEHDSCPEGGHIFGSMIHERIPPLERGGAGAAHRPYPTLHRPYHIPYLAASFFPVGSGFAAAFNNSAE